MSGTAEEKEQLKGMSAKKKEIEAQISELNKQIWKKQEVYKNDVEKRLIEDGILQEAKFSKRMKPETVDELETTIRELHDKYGIMPKAVKYSPLDVRDATVTYNWLDDTIYLSNNFNDSKEYLEKVAKSENSLVEYNKHYDIVNRAEKSLKEADTVLADKSVKGFEREEARLKKVQAEIQLNEKRMAVRESLSDCFTHEYGHFIHRHAETNYTTKKDAFGMRDLGGVFYERDWRYDVNKYYSARAKVVASGISRYAAENPYETFAEGFLAMEKGEKIPDQIAEVIEEAKKRAGAKTVAKEAGSGIIKHNRFNTNADPIREVIGSAEQSHPEELKKIMEDLEASGVKVRRRENAMGYMPALSAGKPGEIIVEEGASYSAWLHEYKHFIDDRNDGYPGMRILENREKCIQREKDAYAIEIEFAKSYGRDDIVKRLEELRDEEVKRWQT